MGTLGTISLCGQILIYYWPGIAVARCNIVPIKEDLFIGRVYGGGGGECKNMVDRSKNCKCDSVYSLYKLI